MTVIGKLLNLFIMYCVLLYVAFSLIYPLHASVPAFFFFYISSVVHCVHIVITVHFFFVPFFFFFYKRNLNHVNFNLCTSLWVVQTISDLFLRVKRWSR
jgi:hypothetical protein